MQPGDEEQAFEVFALDRQGGVEEVDLPRLCRDGEPRETGVVDLHRRCPVLRRSAGQRPEKWTYPPNPSGVIGGAAGPMPRTEVPRK